MGHRYLLMLMMAGALVCPAQSKLDIAGSRIVSEYRAIKSGEVLKNTDVRLAGSVVYSPILGKRESKSSVSDNIDDRMIGSLVFLKDDSTGEDFTLDGRVEVVNSVGDACFIVNVPIGMLEELSSLDCVRLVTVGDKKETSMMKARAISMVDEVHAGTGLDRSYKGSGVVVGMFDTGMDPNHINFTRSGDSEESRVKVVYEYSGRGGKPTKSVTTPEAIKNYKTDKTTETHGTHVMGIAVGGYTGAGTIADESGAVLDLESFPLYGVAPEADIAMTGGDLYDENIIDGIERVIAYAESQGKPAVVNLSLGSVYGTHDGTGGDNQALALLGKRGIICIAAGNDGESKLGFLWDKDEGTEAENLNNTVGFSAYDSSKGTEVFIINNKKQYETAADTIALEFVLLDGSKNVVYKKTIHNTNGKYIKLGGSGLGSTYETVDQFPSTAWITFRSFFNAANDKYAIEVQHTLPTMDYYPCVRAQRQNGQVVYGVQARGRFTNHGLSGAYSDGSTTWSALSDGSEDFSISDMATGENVIVVGSYNSATYFGRLNGSVNNYGQASVGGISSFSSYGQNMLTDEWLPNVCAPGSAVLSSYSTYYSGTRESTMSGKVTEGSNTYYWGSMQGTSMATPFVTGTIALWLEANPNLTVDDVKKIIQKTSTASVESRADDSNRWGAGKINALEGLKESLVTVTAIDGVFEDDEKRFVLEQGGDALGIFVAGADRIDAQLFAVSGQQVARQRGGGEELSLSTSGLQHGFYVLKVETSVGQFTRKVAIR